MESWCCNSDIKGRIEWMGSGNCQAGSGCYKGIETIGSGGGEGKGFVGGIEGGASKTIIRRL